MPDSVPAPILLVIDADDAMRALVREWAAMAGYRVHVRASPGAHGDADVNLVIVDLCDLATRGAATVSRVKKLFPAAGVLGLSTQASRPIAGRVLESLAPGLAALLPKPCARGELLAAVAGALGQATPGRAPHADDAAVPAHPAGSAR